MAEDHDRVGEVEISEEYDEADVMVECFHYLKKIAVFITTVLWGWGVEDGPKKNGDENLRRK